jgi:hypothetical protein
MSDYETPDFYAKVARGKIINSPMTQQKTLYSCTPSNFENYLGPSFDSNGDINETSGFLDRGSIPPEILCANAVYPTVPDIGDTAKNVALINAWANVDVSKVQSLVTIAEARKTVNSVTDIFGRFIGILRNLRKLRLAEVAKEFSPRELADRYLEVRYALRPLMYDLHGYTKAWNTKLIYDRFTARGFSSETFSDTYNGQVQNYSSFKTNYSSYISKTVESRAGVLYHYELDGLEDLRVYGFDQPIESLWELVPFSFIIDWFFNIGNTIAAWTPNSGITPLASWAKTTTTIVKSCTITGLEITPNQYTDQTSRGRHAFANGAFSSTDITIERVPDPSRPILPSLNINLDIFKLLDLLLIGNKLRS